MMDREEFFISVIIPVYNGEKYIEETINSLVNQPNKSLEIIVVDDGSTDNTYNVVKKWTKTCRRIRVFRIENSGVSIARNYGISKATGRWIAFLDADDIWCENVYDEELETIVDSRDAQIVSFGYYVSDNNLNIINTYHPVYNKYENNMYINKSGHAMFSFSYHHSSFFYLREMMSDNNINYPEKIRMSEDDYFKNIALFHSNKICVCQRFLFKYRMHNMSTVHQFNDRIINFKTIGAWKLLKEYFVKNNYFDKDIINWLEGNICWRVVDYFIYYAKLGFQKEQLTNYLKVNQIEKYISSQWLIESNWDKKYIKIFSFYEKYPEIMLFIFRIQGLTLRFKLFIKKLQRKIE